MRGHQKTCKKLVDWIVKHRLLEIKFFMKKIGDWRPGNPVIIIKKHHEEDWRPGYYDSFVEVEPKSNFSQFLT